MPAFAADKLLPHIQAAHNVSVLLTFKGIVQKEKSTEIESRFQTMIQDINKTKEAKSSGEVFQRRLRQRQKLSLEDSEKLYQINPGDNFRKIKIIPSKEEILADEEPFLRPNKIEGKYPSSLTYLDVQFRLLREDFLALLRESVKKYFLIAA